MKKIAFIAFLLLLLAILSSGCNQNNGDKGVVICKVLEDVAPIKVQVDDDFTFIKYTKEYIDKQCIITIVFEE